MFRKSYIAEKKTLDDWLRMIRVLDITTNELKKQKAIKMFSKAFIRQIKNPAVTFETGLKQPANPEDDPHGLRTHGKPMFELDNSHNIMVVRGNELDTKLLVESFLQANIKARTKYKCILLHHCTRENKLSCDSVFIIKNMICSIIRQVPSIKNYFKF